MCWITRKHPFSKARLIDTGQIVDFSKQTTAKDVVTVIASHPLTDNEEWILMQPKSLEVVENGKSVFSRVA